MPDDKHAPASEWGLDHQMLSENKAWRRNARRARLAPIFTLLVCALILMGMALLDRFQNREFDQEVRLARELGQVRSTLLSGFSRISLGAEELSAAELEAERASMLQGLERLQRSAAAVAIELPDHMSHIAGLSEALRKQLAEAAPPFVQQRDLPALQHTFDELNLALVREQALSADHVDALLRRQQSQYSLGWIIALGLLVLVAVAIARNNRVLGSTQATMRENAAQFQRLLDMLPQLTWVSDVQGNIEYMNSRWSEFSGRPQSELLGAGWQSLMHPDDRETIAKWGVAAVAGEQSISEFRLRRHDGEYRWFDARFGVSRNERGQPVRWFGSTIDIHDIKLAKAALEHSEQFHRSTLSALNEGVITFDTQGQVIGCNSAAERMVGMSRASMLREAPQRWGISFKTEHGESVPWQTGPVARALETGIAQRDVLILAKGRAGEERWLRLNAEPVRASADSKVTAVVTSFHDVSGRMRAHSELRLHRDHLESLVKERTCELTAEIEARTQAEQQALALNAQLKEAERFVRVVADNVPGRIIYWDTQVRCRFVNRMYVDWFGDSADGMLGRSMLEIRGADYYENAQARILAALGGEPQDFERNEHSIRGAEVHTRYQYIPDRRDGEVKGIVVLATDITRHKRIEQLLRLANEQLGEARDRATAASQAKSTFLANMSHEIRTPMNAIIGFTHMLRREIQDPQNQQRLSKIANASNHLLQVINDILDLSRIEAGKLVLEGADFSLDALLSRTCSMVAETAREKGLELVVSLEPMPDRLRGDPTRLMQALLNLLGNAVKFTDHGSVSLRVALLEQDRDTMLIRFEVRDTGMGIAPEELAMLFNPFAQADNSSTRLHGGTGLGLAITRHIAEQMGGEAGGDSLPGRGSRFWFSAKLTAIAQPDSVPMTELGGMRALVADDLPEARSALTEMLQSLGLRVDMVDSGTEALDYVRRADAHGDPYQLVLLDWAMPGLDGMETGARLNDALEPPQAMVLVSARDHAAIQQLARDAGFGAVLMKPVTVSVLQDCLVRLLRNATRPGTLSDLSAPLDDRLPASHLGARVLLAEDNPVNQEVATQLLQAAGLQVDVAQDGREAVEMAHARHYDLVLMDMQMPHMDGLQATRAMRQSEALAGLPIIAMTANAFQEARQACLDAGMNDHLSKPVDPRLLHAMLLRWLPVRRQTSGFASLQAQDDGGKDAAAPDTRPPDSVLNSALERTVEERLASMASLVDLPRAYEYCAGQPSILMRVMEQFVVHYRGAGAAFIEQVLGGQTDVAARGLHSLRGVSGMMGADKLRDMTVQVEQSIRDGLPHLDLLPQMQLLCTELDMLVSEIQHRLDV